jgi:hypothetical protein
MTLRFAGRDIDAGVVATVGARGEVSLSRSRG